MIETASEAGNHQLFAHDPVSRVPLSAKFAQAVVCELRFPLLLELGDSRPPSAFVHALRRRYPQMQHFNEISLGPGGPGSPTGAHSFQALRGGWTVTLKPSSVAMEAKAYGGYDGFRERVAELVAAAAPVIDSDFWTRIGLRYINRVPLPKNHTGALADFVHEALAAPLDRRVFKQVQEYSGAIRGGDEEHGYLLQHGLRREGGPQGIELSYLIDIDAWQAECELERTLETLDALHAQSFAVFDWCLGPASRKELEAGK